MKRFFLTLLYVVVFSGFSFAQSLTSKVANDQKEVDQVLDLLNKYAAEAKFESYFDLFASESTFIGTDALEVWNKKEFMEYAEPHFRKGKAWNFTSIKRNITFDSSGKIAWFDELLSTQMKLCRGSGVLEKIDGKWKIKQYVLSMTIPNDNVNEVIKIKAPIEDEILKEFSRK